MNNVQNYLFLSYLQNIFAQIDAFCAFFGGLFYSLIGRKCKLGRRA